MVITKAFNLDINTPWKAPTLYIKQGDADSRKLQATIRRDGVNYIIPGDVAASFRMKKPDGTIVTQDCTISGSVVSVVMDAQCATAAGHAKAEIVLATAGEVVSTFLLAIEVMPAAVTDGDIESHDALGEYRTILEEMLRVKGAPLTANTAADMTDTDRVYVYTGSEVGYVNGSWYYYDGDSWEVGGVYNSQAISDAFYNDIAQLVKQSAVASESDSVPYLYRPTPNPSAILADEEIVGGTIAWNQLCNSASVTVPNGHKYYLLKAGASSITASTGSAVTGLDDGTDMVIDLTAMFGSTIADYLYTLESGTAGAGVAKLREWGFLSKKYFAHDSGSLVSVNTSGKRVTGKNIFNCTWESGSFDANGNETSSASAKRTVESIPVTPNTQYSFSAKAPFDFTGGSVVAYEFRSDGTFVNVGTVMQGMTDSNPYTFTTSANAEVIRLRFYRTAGNGGVAVVDTAEFMLERGVATSFESYRETTYPTTPTDLNGIFKLDSNNNLYADGDIYHANGTIEHRWNKADITSYSVSTTSTPHVFVFVLNATNTGNKRRKYGTNADGITGLMSGGYSFYGNGSSSHVYPGLANMQFGFLATTATVAIRNDSCTTAAEMETALNGLHIVYEIDDQDKYTDTADPYPATQIAGSKEEWIDNRAVPVPVGHRTVYSIGVPDVPASGSNLVLKATASGGKTTLKWE